jgi:hypothetical protein
VEPEKQTFIGNGCATHNNGVTVGRGVFFAVSAEAIKRGPVGIMGESSDSSEKSRKLV